MRQPSLCLVLCRLFLSAAQHVRMTCGPLAGEHLLGCSVALAMPYVSTGRSKAKAMKMGMETWASFEAGLRCAVFGLGPRPRPRPLPVHCSRQHWRHDSEWFSFCSYQQTLQAEPTASACCSRRYVASDRGRARHFGRRAPFLRRCVQHCPLSFDLWISKVVNFGQLARDIHPRFGKVGEIWRRFHKLS